MTPDFDVAVVGAGIAGSVVARQLANAGREVVLIERGETPGSKNLSGGVLFGRGLEEVFGGAPVERRITRHVLQTLTAEASVGLDYADARLGSPANAVSVLRAKLDPWLASRAEEAGATVLTGVRVDSVLRDEGRVVGVRAGEDDLTARVVVAADGINSFVAKDAGLRGPDDPAHLGLGVKAVVALPRTVLADRFRLAGDEGASYAVVGDATLGVPGGGFLYTNLDSVSVGIVVRLDALAASGRSSAEVFEHFCDHPFVAGLLQGGEVVEYGAHLVAEGGLRGLGGLVGDGIVAVGDAAGLTINTGLTIRGMDLAAASGLAAARAIEAALAASDVSKASLDAYRRDLMSGVVGRDLTTYARTPGVLARPRLHDDYGRLLADALRGAFAHDGTPRRPLRSVVRGALKGSGVRAKDLVGDLWAGVRGL